ncbi:hypothetical protein [Streptomyces sp. NPDC001404]|uniref:hypothetical protein n=1 Tax=Streptomyces sp. NPDC001404 TaxID=3364571 RepID=UPI0036A6D215
MFKGSAEEARRQEQRARAVAERAAKVLNELEEFGPVFMGRGEIVFFGGSIRQRESGWSVR